MATLGLVLIILAWAIQLVLVYQKKFQLNPLFVLIYCFGILALVIDGYSSGLSMLATLNLIVLMLGAAILYLIRDKIES